MIARHLPPVDHARTFARKVLVSALGTLSSPHHPDRYLELVDPLLATSVTRARITHVDRNASGSVTFTVSPARPVRFEPGSHVPLSITVDGVRHTRTYSPAYAPGAVRDGSGPIVFTVGLHPDGIVSRHLYEHAQPGLVVELGEPAGDFVLPTPRSERLILIGGGSGITPVLSMLEGLAAEGHTGAVTFLYYARTPAHVPRREALDALAALPNVEVVVVYTRSGDGALQGRFDAAHLQAVAPWFAGTPVYVCGPAGLVSRVRDVYARDGAENLVHVEEFTPPTYTVDPDDATGTVSFASSGVVADNTGVTVLEHAENAGLTPEHGCRMGICHSCTAVRLSGCTRDVRTGELDSEPGTRIQICINAPVGDVAVDL
ncbi:ferredoxin reductase [Rhodococcus sp. BL-253-APC-6A1W]|uniref:ferredoxin reductase n=1 Tax=Rhodococcus sp. BL-253-APC-6A1W TaxID=2725307 RepID=UPI00146E8EC2|nr:ferredoxin reductase [Rhodococcus sp. BL-253-APC-6A1W]NMD95128.1 ferredoxin reductase [Rhodococcus sp. BL-253-APC-6A1W]